MKEYIKKLAKSGVFLMIGGRNIEFPIRMIWWGDDPLGMLLQDGVDVVNLLIGLSSVAAVGMIIVSAYKLITAAGDPDKIESGQRTLTAAVVGLIIVWIVGLIIRFVLISMNVI